MPSYRIRGYLFRFYANEGIEPPHVHVYHDRNQAKVWLQPLAVAYNQGYTDKQLNEILRIVEANRDLFLGGWYEFFRR